jgi:hypothetical protein
MESDKNHFVFVWLTQIFDLDLQACSVLVLWRVIRGKSISRTLIVFVCFVATFT